MSQSKFTPPSEIAGLAARRIAADIIDTVLHKKRPLDDQLDGAAAHPGLKTLSDRDRALMRRIVATVLRRLGTLRFVLSKLLDKGVPGEAPRAESALLIGAAQILWMDVPDHAAVDLSVRLVQADRRAARYAGLVNAVLRRCAREGPPLIEGLEGQSLDIPPWMMTRWIAHYGEANAQAMASAISADPSLDLTVKGDPASWAARLHGEVLPMGTVRAPLHGAVTTMPGFNEGAWWVQDAAAAMPVKLFGDLSGKRVADFCAAPGGKTMQLAQAGAEVTAIDRSPNRIRRLSENFARVGLQATMLVADAAEWDGGGQTFDAILIDAPCTATGTIRRHPDVAWLKTPDDMTALSALQQRLLRNASKLLKDGGTLVYCTCSLEPEEGEQAVAAVLAEDPSLSRVPIDASELDGHAELINPDGDLRTLPSHFPHSDATMAGLDGFYAARLRKTAG